MGKLTNYKIYKSAFSVAMLVITGGSTNPMEPPWEALASLPGGLSTGDGREGVAAAACGLP